MIQRRAPSDTIVVDANIFLGIVVGVRGRAAWDQIVSNRRLVTSVAAVAEVMTVTTRIADRHPSAQLRARQLIDCIDVPPEHRYESALKTAASVLRNAPASRNGSESDAHILALAWASVSDIWTHDRDFAGTGWPSWSSSNLVTALQEEAGASETAN